MSKFLVVFFLGFASMYQTPAMANCSHGCFAQPIGPVGRAVVGTARVARGAVRLGGRAAFRTARFAGLVTRGALIGSARVVRGAAIGSARLVRGVAIVGGRSAILAVRGTGRVVVGSGRFLFGRRAFM